MGETAASKPAKRVFVHVGAPKSGTTYLQHILWQNREQLASDGILYPLERQFEHFAATMDLRESTWGHGFRDPVWERAWDRIADRARDWDGPTVVFSNELLGGATAEQVQRAYASLQPAEIHVVFTARDLARQLPSDWQEQIKHTHTVTLDRFVDDLVRLGIAAPPPFGEMFWGLHDPVRVLQSWRSDLPPERIHIVTVPQPGGPRAALWERFAGLLGAAPSGYDTAVWGNASLGRAETEFLRRLNVALGNRAGRYYDLLVRVRLAESILAERRNAPKARLPRRHHEWIVQRSHEMIESLRAAGYAVSGNLDELLPASPPDDPEVPPQQTSAADLTEVGIHALAGMLHKLAGMQAYAKSRERELAVERESRRSTSDRAAEGREVAR